MEKGGFAGDTVGHLVKIEGTLNQQRHANPSGLRLVGPSLLFEQGIDPTHASKLRQGYLTEEDGCHVTWPPLNPIQRIWDERERRGKPKGPTRARWELL